MYGHIYDINVDLQDSVQLYPGEISGAGSVRRLGSDGRRLGLQGTVLHCAVLQRRMEEAGVGINVFGGRYYSGGYILMLIKASDESQK